MTRNIKIVETSYTQFIKVVVFGVKYEIAKEYEFALQFDYDYLTDLDKEEIEHQVKEWLTTNEITFSSFDIYISNLMEYQKAYSEI